MIKKVKVRTPLIPFNFALSFGEGWGGAAYKLTIFSFLFLLMACVKTKESSPTKIEILWKDSHAKGIVIPLSQLENTDKENIKSLVKVRLSKAGEQSAILGEYILNDKELVFKPLIPFTRGLKYEVMLDKKTLAEIEIPKTTDSPELLAIYPSQDTLPENLLKMYLVFSQPMREGNSLNYITFADQKGNPQPNTFLNLQQELWNEDRTILTLWLNPGRIKRDLQPNKELGNPLIQGQKYQLIISDKWTDKQGVSLQKSYTKNLVAGSRDMSSPKPDEWKLKIPQKGTTQALEINLQESLDYILLKSTIYLIDNAGNVVNGSVEIKEEERKYCLIPSQAWASGAYTLQIETRLEDLAGNNLNRLFDREVKNNNTSVPTKKFFEKKWEIK